MNQSQDDKRFSTDDVSEAFGQMLLQLSERLPAAAMTIVRQEANRVVGDIRLREQVEATLEMTCPDDGAELVLRGDGRARQCPLCREVWDSAEAVLYEREHRVLARLALLEDATLDDMWASTD